jgi:predicted Fe-Mo cluster-binding NifX family protein
MASKLVTIATYYDYMEASMAKQMLEDEGIAAVIVGEKLSTAIGGLPALAMIELQVNETDAETALEVLKDLENPPDILNPYEDGFEETDEEEQ